MYIVHKTTIIVCGFATLLLIAIGLFQSFDENIKFGLVLSLGMLSLTTIDFFEARRTKRPKTTLKEWMRDGTRIIPYVLIVVTGSMVWFIYSYLFGWGIILLGWCGFFYSVTQKNKKRFLKYSYREESMYSSCFFISSSSSCIFLPIML